MPPALTDQTSQEIVDRAVRGDDPAQNAIVLFVALAKAQPFEDGNKRTATVAANAVLISSGVEPLLTVPVDHMTRLSPPSSSTCSHAPTRSARRPA